MYDQHPLIEALLHVHRDALGGDLGKYRNHVYRVFHLSLYFLPGNPASEDVEKLAIAAVFHDIGIWTHHTFDYLEPAPQWRKHT